MEQETSIVAFIKLSGDGVNGNGMLFVQLNRLIFQTRSGHNSLLSIDHLNLKLNVAQRFQPLKGSGCSAAFS